MEKNRHKENNPFSDADISGMSPEQQEIFRWLSQVKFRRHLLGGVQEADVWRKLEELNQLYEKALLVQKSRAGDENA